MFTLLFSLNLFLKRSIKYCEIYNKNSETNEKMFELNAIINSIPKSC